MERNKHMNVFEEYSHGGKMPLENNLTRALAISLEENVLFLKTFLVYISKIINRPSLKKHAMDLSLDNSKKREKSLNCNVGIQFDLDNVNELGRIDKIYGLTLTTKKYKFEKIKTKKTDKKEITDIIINIDNILVIIEAKRNSVNANNQLERQIDKAISKCSNSNIIDRTKGSMKWEDVFLILDHFYKLKFRTDDRIIDDFNALLYEYLAECAPSRKLGELKALKNNKNISNNYDLFVNARLLNIKQEYIRKSYAKKFLDSTQLKHARKNIQLNIPYLAECNFEYDAENSMINTVMYIGSKGSQYWRFKKSELSERIFDIKDIEGFEIEIKPYIKFSSNYGRYLNHYEVYEKEVEKYQDIIGRFKKEHGIWKKRNCNLLTKIKTMCPGNFADFDSLDDFRKDFRETVKNKSTVLCTTEYCVKVKIPYDDAVLLDEKNEMPKLLHEIIKTMAPQ